MSKRRAESRTPGNFSPLEILELFGKANDGLKIICESMREIEAQRTERTKIEAQARTYVARVQSAKDVMLFYLEKSFDERRELFAKLFSILDRAMDEGNLTALSATLGSMVDLAKSSPFKALQDAAAFEQALGDPSTEWRF